MEKSNKHNESILMACQSHLINYGVTFTIEDVISSYRGAEIVFVRALICAILRHNGYTLHSIGEIINRDHSNVVHLLKYSRQQKRNAEYENIIQHLDKMEIANREESIISLIRFHETEIERLKQKLQVA